MALTKVPSNLDATIATTQSQADNSTNIATTAYVDLAVSNLSDSAPAALNTLNEIAAALGDDANYASTTTAAIAAKLPLAGGTMTGNLTVNAIVDADNFKINGGQGSDGQVLTSTGSGIAWEAIPAGGVAGIVTSADATAITIDSLENVGIGVVPEAWYSYYDVLQIGSGASLAGSTTNKSRAFLNANVYINSSNAQSYIATDEASQYWQNGGTHIFNVAASGTADSTISWTTAMTIDSTGNVGIGTPGYGTYHSDTVVLGLGTGSTIRAANSGADPYVTMANNAYHDASSWKYIHADFASSYEQYNGTHVWNTAASGSAGATVPFGPRMKIDADGNVGIGTQAPSANTPLTAYYSSTSQFNIGGPQAGISNNVYYNGSAYVNRNTSAGGALLQMGTAGTFAFRRATSGSSPTLSYSMYIDANGNVGIGTASPAKLGLTGSSTGKVLELTGDDCQIRLANSILHHDNSGNTTLHLRNHYGATSSYARTKIESGFITFHTGTSFTERMRIDSTGIVLLSDTSQLVQGSNFATSGGTGGYRLKIDSNAPRMNWFNDAGVTRSVMYFYYEGVERGSIQVRSGSTAYLTSSDYRLKENVAYTWDATTRLKQLKPARFNFTNDADTIVDGFLAHEVSSIVPEAISGTKDAMTAQVLYTEGDELPDGKSVGDVKEASVPDYQGIDQSKLIPLLVKTIQELEARITTLEE